MPCVKGKKGQVHFNHEAERVPLPGGARGGLNVTINDMQEEQAEINVQTGEANTNGRTKNP